MFLWYELYHVRLLYQHALTLVTKTLKSKYQVISRNKDAEIEKARIISRNKDAEIEKARIISRNKDAEIKISRVISRNKDAEIEKARVNLLNKDAEIKIGRATCNPSNKHAKNTKQLEFFLSF